MQLIIQLPLDISKCYTEQTSNIIPYLITFFQEKLSCLEAMLDIYDISHRGFGKLSCYGKHKKPILVPSPDLLPQNSLFAYTSSPWKMALYNSTFMFPELFCYSPDHPLTSKQNPASSQSVSSRKSGLDVKRPCCKDEVGTSLRQKALFVLWRHHGNRRAAVKGDLHLSGCHGRPPA